MYGATQDLLLIGSCTFDPRSLTLRDAAGSTLHLRSQSVRVLAELVRTPGAIVPRDVLIETVWQGVAVTDDSLVQCIKDIRTALADSDHTVLRTVVGQGYAISARIVSDDADAPPRVCIERFKVAGDGPEAGELSDALFENLVMRLAPRAGITVVTAPCRPMDAGYVISGRVSARGGRTRIFAQIVRLVVVVRSIEIAAGDVRISDRHESLPRSNAGVIFITSPCRPGIGGRIHQMIEVDRR